MVNDRPRTRTSRVNLHGAETRTINPACETSGIAMLSKHSYRYLLRCGESDPPPEFVKARVRMKILQTLIHRKIRQ